MPETPTPRSRPPLQLQRSEAAERNRIRKFLQCIFLGEHECAREPAGLQFESSKIHGQGDNSRCPPSRWGARVRSSPGESHPAEPGGPGEGRPVEPSGPGKCGRASLGRSRRLASHPCAGFLGRPPPTPRPGRAAITRSLDRPRPGGLRGLVGLAGRHPGEGPRGQRRPPARARTAPVDAPDRIGHALERKTPASLPGGGRFACSSTFFSYSASEGWRQYWDRTQTLVAVKWTALDGVIGAQAVQGELRSNGGAAMRSPDRWCRPASGLETRPDR